MPRQKINQKFGSWLNNVQVVANGDLCSIRSPGSGQVSFRLSEVTRVMVSTRSGLFMGKGNRIIHLLGPTGVVAKITCNGRAADAQAAATFVRHLLQESKRARARGPVR